MGIPADDFTVRITTLTPLTPRRDLRDFEEGVLYPFGRSKPESKVDEGSEEDPDKSLADRFPKGNP